MAQNKTKINWSFGALVDLADIHEDIAGISSDVSADKFVDDLMEKVKRLEVFPEAYHPCPSPKLKNTGHRCMNFKK